MPLHRPCSWGQAMGGSERASRRCISVHPAGGPRGLMNSLRPAYRAESRTHAALEMVVVHWLAEIANNADPWRPIPNNLVGVRGNEDRRDRVSCIDQMPVQL